MRETALELVEGHYQIKTNIRQKSEIGELAETLDILSDRLQKNEEERNNMEQMRMDFFANVSHELRTPITVLRGYTESLVDGVIVNEEKVKQYYNRMLLECKSMERLVSDLLILSKMQNPDFAIDAEPVNLVQVFDDIVRSANVMSAKKQISIEMTKDNDCCMMMGDYDRLRQMFMVIVDNAVKFSEENSKIYINLTSIDKIKVIIQDLGCGISEDELPNIFEKFYKSKLRQNANGSGLGLVIAKQIAMKHGGEIMVSSKVGDGTTFIFTFDKLDMERDFQEI
jgi:signal transduction histidine kinase